ncbi:MAG: HNH endonuclease [Alphaproteobacteria bacterium]
MARVAAVVPDPDRAGHFYALIEDYLPFDRPVPFREGATTYEDGLTTADGTTNTAYFLNAVRALADHEFEAILSAGFPAIDELERLIAEGTHRAGDSATPSYALAEDTAPLLRPMAERLSRRPVRDALFARQIRQAYDSTCAVTGLRIINGGGRSEMEAAHIRPVEAQGNDSPRNGLALSRTVHWLFDRGLISLTDDYRLLAARRYLEEPLQRLLPPDNRLRKLPDDPTARPHPAYLAWHREHRFQG